MSPWARSAQKSWLFCFCIQTCAANREFVESHLVDKLWKITSNMTTELCFSPYFFFYFLLVHLSDFVKANTAVSANT